MLTKSIFSRRRSINALFLVIVFLVSALIFSSILHAQTPSGVDGKSSFTARLINIEAPVNEVFRYNTTLHNGSADTRIYELHAQVPDGWSVSFKADGTQVTSLSMDAGKTQDISIEINAGFSAKPSKYAIPVTAVSSSDTLALNLEAVVKGAYKVELTTPTGRLSDEVTEGSHKEIHLTVKNAGSLPLDGLDLSAQAPSKWEATFEPSKIEKLEPGKTADVVATLNVPDKTIAGDYVTTFTVKNSNANADASFRMTVKTSVLSGWIGILVILLAIALVYYLIRKYGRR